MKEWSCYWISVFVQGGNVHVHTVWLFFGTCNLLQHRIRTWIWWRIQGFVVLHSTPPILRVANLLDSTMPPEFPTAVCVSVLKTTRLPNGNSKEAAVMFLATFCSLVLYLQLQLDFCDGVRHIYLHLKFFKCLPWDLQWTSSSYALSLASHFLCRKSGRPSLPKPESLEAAESALESRKSIGQVSHFGASWRI